MFSTPYTNILVTGGAGFIGCNLVRRWLKANPNLKIHIIDKLTYAGNLASLREVREDSDLSSRIMFHKYDICDAEHIGDIFKYHMPQAVVHLAAESHVDRSIDNAAPFIQTNVVGTQVLLDTALKHYHTNCDTPFRFIQVSTDEVYGSVGSKKGSWKKGNRTAEETDALNPTSPYAASKAAGDLLALSYHKTHGLPVIVTRSTNNFGPYQYPEKFIPMTILKALAVNSNPESIPLYGTGRNIRSWLHVDDHCNALMHVLNKGMPGEIYNIGSCSEDNEQTNLDVVKFILSDLNQPETMIKFVEDRPGHDMCYAVETHKINCLGWCDAEHFETKLRETITWYYKNTGWVADVLGGKYNMERLGLGQA